MWCRFAPSRLERKGGLGRTGVAGLPPSRLGAAFGNQRTRFREAEQNLRSNRILQTGRQTTQHMETILNFESFFQELLGGLTFEELVTS